MSHSIVPIPTVTWHRKAEKKKQPNVKGEAHHLACKRAAVTLLLLLFNIHSKYACCVVAVPYVLLAVEDASSLCSGV